MDGRRRLSPPLSFLSSRGSQRRGSPPFGSPALSPPREGFLAALGMTGAHASHHGWSEEVVPPFHFCHPEERSDEGSLSSTPRRLRLGERDPRCARNDRGARIASWTVGVTEMEGRGQPPSPSRSRRCPTARRC